jgi:multicomponent Na+:H+ antiporter subunit A
MTAATLIVLAPSSLLLGALLQILIARLCSARVKGILAVLTCLPAVFAVIGMLPLVHAGQAVDVNLFGWDGPLALVLHVDALSVLFAFMGSCLGAIVLLYSIGYMAHDKAASRFYFSMLIFIGGFIGLVYSANLLFFYLCWEVIGLCSFTLVGFWYTNPESVAGARKVLLMTHIAGYGLLAAILIVFHRTGSMLWTDPAVARSFGGGIFVLMLISLVAKSVQVPLHTWIPEAMAAPTPVSALLHAACYVKAGVYLAARMHSFGAWPVPFSATVVWVGTITMAVGVMYAMVQTDLKRMLAFHTVSQIGYMVTGLGIGSPLAITAGLLHCLNHGFFKGGLFLSAGSVQHATGTRDMNQLGGLAQRMPRTTFAWLISVGSMMGIPLLSGFTSKWMLYTAALQSGWTIPALVAWAVSLGTVFSCVKATDAVFLGPVTDKTRDAHESPRTMQWGLILIAAGSVVLGVAPQLAVNYFLNPILAALGMGTGIQVTWFGLFGSAGSFSTTGGLVLALVSLVPGIVILALGRVARPAVAISGGAVLAGAGGGDVFTGGQFLGDDGRFTAHDFSNTFEKKWKTFFRWTNVDRVYLGVWQGLLAISRGLAVLVSWMESNATVLVVLFAAALLAGVRWLTPGSPSVEALVEPRMPGLLIAGCFVAACALILAALTQAKWRRLTPLMVLTAASTLAGLALSSPWQRLGLLELGALLTIPLVWQSARSSAARTVYATVVVISATCLVFSNLLLDGGQPDWARALLLTSITVKLATVPLFFWLLKLADELPALVLGLIIAVVDMAAFGELYVLAQVSPWALSPQGLWLGLAAATALLASLLMLSQRSMKRMLVLATVKDCGFLLLGVASASVLGYSGVLVVAATHSVAKALLFACLSAPEADGKLDNECTGLINWYPVSGFGFLFGMLAMVGLPPTMGFIGKWRLYETALQLNPLLLAVFLLSSIFALIAYVLALTHNWWGTARGSDPPVREPVLLRGAIVVLVVLLVTAGLWPNVLQMLYWGRP